MEVEFNGICCIVVPVITPFAVLKNCFAERPNTADKGKETQPVTEVPTTVKVRITFINFVRGF